jgi:hypothetical protein
MPPTNNPSTPQTDRTGPANIDRDKQGQSSRPDQNRDSKSGRPQDDRDPNSPARGTQRPDGSTIVDAGNQDDGNEADVKDDSRGAANSGKPRTDDSPGRL